MPTASIPSSTPSVSANGLTRSPATCGRSACAPGSIRCNIPPSAPPAKGRSPLLAYAAKRLIVALLVAFTVSIISFALLHLSGDLAQSMAGPSATAADVEQVRKAYGLDRPIPLQYLEWIGKAVRGNFGESFFLKVPVAELIADRLPVTLTLGICALLFALTLSLPLGVLAAVRPN